MSALQAAWRAIQEMGVPRRHGPKTVLLRQGDRGTHVFLLMHGNVKVVRSDRDGGELLLAIREPVDLLGELAVLDSGRRSATVSTITPCLTYAIAAERFIRIVQEFKLYDFLIRRGIQRLREAEEIRADRATLSAGPLVARTLLRLATGPEVPLTQQELASATGLSRSAVTAELAGLRRAEVIRTIRGRVRIDDFDALSQIASA